MLDSFRGNYSMTHAIRKMKVVTDLVTNMLNSKSFNLERRYVHFMCKLYVLNIMLQTEDPRIFDIMKTVLRKAKLLDVPINPYSINMNFNLNEESSTRNIVAKLSVDYMKNMVLKFDDPFKTGKRLCLIIVEVLVVFWPNMIF